MKIPKLLQNTGIYTVVTVLQKGISFFLLPLYTSILSPSDYGILSVVTSVSSFLSIFVMLGLDAAGSRFYYKEKEDQNYSKRLYGTLACAVVCTSVIFGSLFLFGHKLFIDPIIGDIDFSPFVFLGIINVIITPLFNLFQDYLRTRQEGIRYGINTISHFILNVVLIIIFLTVFNLGVIAVLLANVITSALFFVYVLIVFVPKQKIGIDRTILKNSLNYSLPLLPHTIANWSNSTIDKLLVNGIRSQSETGIYNLADQYGGIMNIVAISVNNAYVPWFYQKINEGEDGLSQITKVGDVLIAIFLVIASILALFSKEVLGIMISNPAYYSVFRIIPFIVFAYVFQGVYFLFVNVLFLQDTKLIFTITLTAMGINVLLNVALIPKFGIFGCGVACILTYLTKSIIALIISQKRNKEVRFRFGWMYVSTFLLFFVVLFVNEILKVSPWWLILIKLGVVCVVILVLFLRFKDQFLKIIPNYVSKNTSRNN